MTKAKRGRERKGVLAASLIVMGLLLGGVEVAQGQVTGTGTSGKVTKWTGTTSVGDSVITETAGGNVGVGAGSPTFKLEVAGHTAVKAAQPAFWLFDTAGTVDQRQFYFWNSGGALVGRWLNDANSTVVAESITMRSSGNVGFGTSNPLYRMDVNGGAASQFHITSNGADSGLYLLSAAPDNGYLTSGASFSGAAWVAKAANAQLFSQSNGAFVFYANTGLTVGSSYTPTERMRLDTTGYLGIGTNAPENVLHTRTGNAHNSLIMDSGVSGPYLTEIALRDRGIYKWEMVKTVDNQFGIYQSGLGLYRLYVRDTGNVGIGTTNPATTLHVVGTATVSGATSTGALTVNGDINATGNIAAKYQDVAEWVPARKVLAAGTVVVLDPEKSNEVMAAVQAYDTRVAGVVSSRPGLILGEGGEGKVMVATTGRVKVRVDATKGAIRVGDLLVTSDLEGVAMRSEPLKLGGTAIHRPGTLIGKALEPLEKGVGEILVLLSLQ